MSRLIDADKLMRHLSDWALYDAAPEIRECMKAVEEQPTVETETVNVAVCVDYYALMEPWCEQYVKDMMARELAHELVNRIEIRSLDTDPRRMLKGFMGRVVIVTGTNTDEVEECVI